jgi:N6-adenosine-specific RNA methylase IME4
MAMTEIALVNESPEQVLAEIRTASEAFGAAKEGTHIAAYAQERVIRNVTWLLAEGRWALAGLNSAGALVDAIRLESYRLSKAEREAIERAVKAADASISNRRIAKMLGVSEMTVRRDVAPDSENANESNGAENASATFVAPGQLSAAEVNALADRRERASAQRARNAETARIQVAPPVGKFETLVIDLPWPMEKIERDVRPNQVAFDYPTMSEEELVAFGETVNRVAADDCHLFLWTTAKFLPMALRLIEAWGFRYVLPMVWRKSGGFQPVGLPQFNCEFIPYARRGTPTFADTTAFNICFDGARREHSRKPDEFYDMISRVTAGPRLDVFSRERREGFAQYGNEPDKFSRAAE